MPIAENITKKTPQNQYYGHLLLNYYIAVTYYPHAYLEHAEKLQNNVLSTYYDPCTLMSIGDEKLNNPAPPLIN